MNELDVNRKQNFGNSSGFGDRPALLIVDFVNGFADPDQFGGGNIDEAITATGNLLASARKANIPVAFARVVYADDGLDAGVFCDKAPGLKNLTEHCLSSSTGISPGTGKSVHDTSMRSASLLSELTVCSTISSRSSGQFEHNLQDRLRRCRGRCRRSVHPLPPTRPPVSRPREKDRPS